MARFQMELIVVVLFFSFFVLARSGDITYCNKKANYVVKIKGVDIHPSPVARGRPANFSISASTDKLISGGKLVIDVSYFFLHVHSETHNLCSETSCPISPGDFLISHSEELPGLTPPGSYTLRLTMMDDKNHQLTCFDFGFSIGFLESEALADS